MTLRAVVNIYAPRWRVATATVLGKVTIRRNGRDHPPALRRVRSIKLCVAWWTAVGPWYSQPLSMLLVDVDTRVISFTQQYQSSMIVVCLLTSPNTTFRTQQLLGAQLKRDNS